MRCLSSDQCRVGQCCETANSSPHFNHCTSTPTRCQRNAGVLDLHDTCQSNASCVTKCCDSFWEQCLAKNTTCMATEGISTSTIALIVSGMFAFLLILVATVIIVCILRSRRRRIQTTPGQPGEDEITRTDITMRSNDLSVEVFEGARVARPVAEFQGSVKSGSPCRAEQAHTCTNIIEPFQPLPLKTEQ